MGVKFWAIISNKQTNKQTNKTKTNKQNKNKQTNKTNKQILGQKHTCIISACTIDVGAAQISYSNSYLNGVALNVPIFSDSNFPQQSILYIVV